MADQLETWLSGFCAVWETVIDIPLKWESRSRRPPEHAAVFFPLLGVLFGAAVLMAGDAGWFFFNRLSGAVVFAFFGTVLWELRDSGRGSRLLATGLGARFRGVPWRESVECAVSDPDEIWVQPAASIYWIILAARFLILLALFRSGAGAWLMIVFLCGFSLQGFLALTPSGAERTALFPGGAKGISALHLTLVLLAVCYYLRFPAGTLAAGIVFYCACRIGTRFLPEDADACNDRITLVAAVTETCLLLLGVLLAI